ncbi:MAG: Secretion system C-terminal sorting domain [Bacteroidota bacterium]
MTNGLQKIVQGTLVSPIVNTGFVSANYPLRGGQVWLYGASGGQNTAGAGVNTNTSVGLAGSPTQFNQPVYSGAVTGAATQNTGSYWSHLDDRYGGFTERSNVSPGFAPDYVMGSTISQRRVRRVFSPQELRIFAQMGYNITIPNLENHPPYTTKTTATNTNTWRWTEDIAPDFTITNNNTTTNLIATSQVINLGTDTRIIDIDNDLVSVQPNTLYNIQGCGNGGNNHLQLSLSTDFRTITYTPRPDFIGRAQFGFYLWDGIERGDYMVYTIDVVAPAGGLPLPADGNLVVNGSFEEGSEVRLGLNPSTLPFTAPTNPIDNGVENTFYDGVSGREGKFVFGKHCADGHPFTKLTQSPAIPNMICIVHNYQLLCSSGLSFGAGGSSPGDQVGDITPCLNFGPARGSYNIPIPAVDAAGQNIGGNRFAPTDNLWNTLIRPVEACKAYSLEFDYLNFYDCQTFTDSLRISFRENLNSTSAAWQLSPVGNIPVGNTQAQNGQWIHVVIPDFIYCGTTSANYMILNTGTSEMFIDNIRLVESATQPAPLAVAITPQNYVISAGSSQPLTTTVTNNNCTTTYLWSNGAITPNINVSPNTTTIYTVTVTSGCSATASVTVNVLNPCFPLTSPITVRNDFTYTGTQTISNQSFVVGGQGISIADGADITFVNCNFLMMPNTLIEVKGRLASNNCRFESCQDMWQGIFVRDDTQGIPATNGTVELMNGSILRHALYGLVLNGNNNAVTVRKTLFDRCSYGIINGNALNRSLFAVSTFRNFICETNTFRCLSPLNTAGNYFTRSGIYLYNSQPVTIGGTSTTMRNTFEHLNNGVSLYKTSATIRKNTFRHIQIFDGTNTPASPFRGCGIFTDNTLTSSESTTGSLFFLNVSNATTTSALSNAQFEGCQTAVWVNNYNTTVAGNTVTSFTPVGATAAVIPEIGVFIKNAKRCTLNIATNAITVQKKGVYLYQNDPVQAVSIANNSITINDLVSTNSEAASGNIAIHIAEANNAPLSTYNVLNNTLNLQTRAAYGIKTETHRGGSFADNTINLQNLAHNRAGIYLQNNNSPILSCNQIQGTGSNVASASQGISLQDTRTGLYSCNMLTNAGSGLFFQGNCTSAPSALRGNTVSTMRTGWFYSPSAYTGQQTQNNGNVWSGSAFTEGVRHEGGNFQVLNSQIFVPNLTNLQAKPSVVNIPNATTALFWQYAGSLTKYNCLTQAACAYNNPCGVPNSCLTVNSSDFATAADELEPTDYVEAQTWRDKRVLYEKLQANPDLVAIYSIFANFQDSVETTEIKDFADQTTAQQGLFLYNSASEAQATATKLQIATYETQLNSLDEALALDTLGLQTETLKAQREAVSQQLSVLATQYENLSTAIDAEADSKLQTATASNGALPDNTVFTYNEKTVNAIYLSTIAVGTTVFDAAQVANLQTIAAQCPLAGGDAVYQARSLLSLYSSTVYNDKQNCYEIGLNYRTAKPKETTKVATTIKVYPNPSTGLVNFDLGRNDYEQVTITIIDILGKQIHSTIAHKNQYAKVDLFTLYSGLYYAKITFDESEVNVLSFSIIK